MSMITRRLSVAVTAAAATLAIGAASAGATITVSPSTNLSATASTSITATLSGAPSGATHYTLAECNVSSTAANWGRDCDASSAVNFTPVATTTHAVTVRKAFTDSSFIPGASPLFSSTTCRGVATLPQCAVLVSWYDDSNPANPIQLSSEKANIAFR